jgi:uncharacterized repeat protein (TIGR01451 family)
MLSRFAHMIAKNVMLMSMLALVLSGGASALVASQVSLANHSECSDGLDNDHDGKIDYPQDNDCESLDDQYEGASLTGLFVSVSDARDTLSPGASVIYTVALRQQREDLRNVDVDLHLPAQLNFASANDGGAIRDGMVHWSKVTVDRNNTTYLTVHANLQPNVTEGTLLVTRVLTEGAEATDTTTVKGVPMPSLARQFAVSITDGQDLARPGDTLHYTIRVKNLSDTVNTANVQVPLPSLVGVVNTSAGADVVSDKIVWKNVTFAPNAEQTFAFTVRVAPHTYKFASIHMRATAASVSAVDDTLLISGTIQGALAAMISDDRTTVERGEILTYTVSVRNLSDRLITDGFVGASMPVYGEFVSAAEGGVWDGTGVHWSELQVAAKGERHLTFQVRVRSDAPNDTVIRGGATVQDQKIFDETTVVAKSNEKGRKPGSITSSHDETVLFRKVASAGETVPGGSVSYTLYVRNVLNHPITDAVITDRFDPKLLSFVSSEAPVDFGAPGTMRIRVPVLQPGESWKATYVLAVSKSAPKGLSINNIATISGGDLKEMTLSARVTVGSMGVVRGMPKTGASMDLLFLLGTVPLGLASAAMQRKLKI